MKFGVVVDSLDVSQKIISTTWELNKIDLDIHCDPIMFYLDYGPIIATPKFAMMDAVNIFGYNGTLISTDIKTTRFILSALSPIKKFFYVWDLEWMMGSYDVKDIAEAYMNENIELIARSNLHFDLLSKYWKQPAGIAEDFNNERITEIISR